VEAPLYGAGPGYGRGPYGRAHRVLALLGLLALVAEVVYGSPASSRDPARFSFAHGGKDGTPYPVNRAVYDQSVDWLRDAVNKARIGHTDRLKALKRLAEWSE